MKLEYYAKTTHLLDK